MGKDGCYIRSKSFWDTNPCHSFCGFYLNVFSIFSILKNEKIQKTLRLVNLMSGTPLTMQCFLKHDQIFILKPFAHCTLGINCGFSKAQKLKSAMFGVVGVIKEDLPHFNSPIHLVLFLVLQCGCVFPGWQCCSTCPRVVPGTRRWFALVW